MTAWITLKDNEISNQWRYGDYLLNYESTTYGMQYNIYDMNYQTIVDLLQSICLLIICLDNLKKAKKER